MSRQNKVNPNHYTMAGRLTPDDLARERKQQAGVRGGTRRSKPMAPWMTRDTPQGTADTRADAEFDLAASEGAPLPRPAEEWPAEPAKDDGATARKTTGTRKTAAARKTAGTRKTAARKAASARQTGGARKTTSARKAAPARTTGRKTSGKTGLTAAGARGTAKVSKAHKGRAKGSGTTRRAQKKR